MMIGVIAEREGICTTSEYRMQCLPVIGLGVSIDQAITKEKEVTILRVFPANLPQGTILVEMSSWLFYLIKSVEN